MNEAQLDEAQLIERARGLYDEACAKLRRKTAAAWTRWEDLPPEAQWRWIDAVRASLPAEER